MRYNFNKIKKWKGKYIREKIYAFFVAISMLASALTWANAANDREINIERSIDGIFSNDKENGGNLPRNILIYIRYEEVINNIKEPVSNIEFCHQWEKVLIVNIILIVNRFIPKRTLIAMYTRFKYMMYSCYWQTMRTWYKLSRE